MKFVAETVKLNSCPPLSSVISRYFIGSPPHGQFGLGLGRRLFHRFRRLCVLLILFLFGLL